jgi:hypothetical protein
VIKWLILHQLKDRRQPIKEEEVLVVEDVDEEAEEVVVATEETEEAEEEAEVEDLAVERTKDLENGSQSPSLVALLLTN